MAHTKLLLPLVLLTFRLSTLQGQSATDTVHQSSNKKVALTVAAASVVYAGSMVALNHIWYEGKDRQSFRFFNDAAEWKQMDKAGHIYSGYYISVAANEILKWSGLPEKKSRWIGAAAGFVMLSSIEYFDGRSVAYGASVSDVGANLLGSAWFLLQSQKGAPSRLRPKFSFHFTDLAKNRPSLLGDGAEEIIKDYNGQTYWLSWQPTTHVKSKWPHWLGISLGYGAHNMIYARDYQNLNDGWDPYRQYYLSFDLFTDTLPVKSKVLKGIFSVFRLVKVPAPTMEFSRKGAKFHPFYF